MQKVAIVLSNPEAVAFFCIAGLMGYGMGTIDSFLFLFLDELGAGTIRGLGKIVVPHTKYSARLQVALTRLCWGAGGSELLMGLTITITCVAEVPVFFFTGWLLEAVGVNVVLHGVLAVYILLLSYYSILQHLVRALAMRMRSCWRY